MKGKLDALSDAIIAIAITVLVLEINTPTSMEGMWQVGLTPKSENLIKTP